MAFPTSSAAYCVIHPIHRSGCHRVLSNHYAGERPNKREKSHRLSFVDKEEEFDYGIGSITLGVEDGDEMEIVDLPDINIVEAYIT
jgi:hypothetical protein